MAQRLGLLRKALNKLTLTKAATRARTDVDALWRLVTGGLPLGLATRVPRGSGQPGRRLAAPRRRCGRSAASRAHRACGRMSGHTRLAGRPVRPPERPGRSGTAQPDRNRPGTRRSDSPEGLPGPSRRWSAGRRRSRLRPRGTGPVTSDDVRGRRAPAFGILVAAGSVGPAAPRHSDHASPEFVKPFQQSDPGLPRRRHGHITAT